MIRWSRTLRSGGSKPASESLTSSSLRPSARELHPSVKAAANASTKCCRRFTSGSGPVMVIRPRYGTSFPLFAVGVRLDRIDGAAVLWAARTKESAALLQGGRLTVAALVMMAEPSGYAPSICWSRSSPARHPHLAAPVDGPWDVALHSVAASAVRPSFP